jgi:hypothetical protein
MPKTKISEFSATPASNTDIDSIFIGEGMAPSNVNDAIRELMAQLKDFQVGSAGDPVTVGGVLTVQAGSASTPSLTTAGDTNTGIFFPAADTIAFAEGGVEAMRMDASGNMGLGVTPSAWNGSSRVFQFGANGTAAFENYNGLTNNMIYNSYRDSSNVARYVTTDRAARTGTSTNGGFTWELAPSGTAGNAITFTQAMTLDASGRLIVGATSASGSNQAEIQAVGTNTGLWVQTGQTSSSYYIADFRNGSNQSTLSLRADNTTLVGGNLLVGTTSATARLTVHAPSGSAPCWFKVATNGDAGIFFANASNSAVGQVTVNSSSTAYVTSSDYRLKNTIAPMTGALDKVALLKPVTYKWNIDGSDSQGFIAHELAEVVPECVIGEKDAVNEDGSIKPQGIDTSFLVATLTAALQEAHGLIKNLETRISALEAK